MWQWIRANANAYPPPMPDTQSWVATIRYADVYIQLKLGLLTEAELQVILASTSIYAKAIRDVAGSEQDDPDHRRYR